MNHFDVLHFFTTGAEVKGLRSVLCQSGVWEGHVRWEEERPGCRRFPAALSGLSVQPEAGSLDPPRYGVPRYSGYHFSRIFSESKILCFINKTVDVFLARQNFSYCMILYLKNINYQAWYTYNVPDA